MLTILVTTRRRRDLLARFFQSLKEQTNTNFLVLLGVQYDDGLLDQIIQEFASSLAIERHTLPPCSLSSARNTLLRHIRSAYVALADDDCYYLPDTVNNFFAACAALPQADGFIASPLARTGPLARRAPKPCNRYMVCRNAPSWCLFLRTAALRDAGCFDERMGIGAPTPWQSAEETDMLVRIIKNRGQIYRVFSIGVCHDPQSAISPASLQKVHNYGMGRMYLLWKHRFPLWFKAANLIYPLMWLPCMCFKKGRSGIRYSMAMFFGRLRGFLDTERQQRYS